MKLHATNARMPDPALLRHLRKIQAYGDQSVDRCPKSGIGVTQTLA